MERQIGEDEELETEERGSQFIATKNNRTECRIYFLCSDGFSSQFSGSLRSSLWTVALSRCSVLMSSSSCSIRTLSDVSFGYISHEILQLAVRTSQPALMQLLATKRVLTARQLCRRGGRLVMLSGVCRRPLSSVTLHGGPAGGFTAQARWWRHAASSLIIAPRWHCTAGQ